MRILYFSCVLALQLMANVATARTEKLPLPLLQLDDYFTHHVLVAEKSTHKLYLYKNDEGMPKLVKTFQMATGKKAGNKIFQGDFRTPEGIFQILDFIPNETLIQRMGKEGEIYGVGAFVMNYPNPIDQMEKKSGGGIWLHSTNDETRIDKGLDSRGCIVISNNELKEVSTYIELNKTSIVTVQDILYLNEESWTRERDSLKSFINSWISAWSTEDINKYIDHYHPKLYYDPSRGSFKRFRNYKRAVFANPGAPEISIDNVSITQTSKYAVIVFKQKYRSSINEDIGKKVLYLKKDDYYNWKIVSERWSKLEEVKDVAFVPSMRFFKE